MVHTDVVGALAGRFASSKRWRLAPIHHAAARLVIGAAVAFVVGLRVISSVNAQPGTMTVEPVAGAGAATLIVASVQKGSFEWLADVRPGQTFVPWDYGEGGYVNAGDVVIGIPSSRPEQSGMEAIAAIGLLGMGVLIGPVMAAAAALLWFAAAALAVSGLMSVATMPGALIVLTAPPIAAFAVVASVRDRRARLALSLTLVATVTGIVWGAFAAQDSSQWTELWVASWALPSVVVLMVLSAVVCGATRQALIATASGGSLAESLLAQTAIGRRALRHVEERRRDEAAQALHDRVLPSVAASLAALERGDLSRSRGRLRELAKEVRKDLDDEQLVVLRMGGLWSAIQGPVARIREHGIECSHRMTPGAGRPPWEVEVAALRILQEALNNVAQHASADNVAVDVVVEARHVRLEVLDDGVGIDPVARGSSRGGTHLGIAAMTDRAEEVGGRLDLEPVHPTGTRVTFRWPA